jgi:uncharacterized protein (DUF2147 family)
MKRFCYFIAWMALSSTAHAGDYSFVVAGHRIHIEAPRHCRSASCVSISIPGLSRSNRWRDRDDEVAASPAPAPANPPSRAIPPVAPVAAPTSSPPVQPVASVAPPPAPPPLPVPQLDSTTAKITVLPAPPQPVAPAVTPPPPPKIEPVKTTEAEPPVVAAKPIPVPTPLPQVAKVSQETEDASAETPIGDWQTEGNTVRIERCGQAMCGYILSLTPNAKGDTILINMKPKTNTAKTDTLWSGSIYSRSSGSTYYATMTLKGISTLRVEACALGRFFCSGNDWTRIGKAPKLITYEETSSRPPS